MILFLSITVETSARNSGIELRPPLPYEAFSYLYLFPKTTQRFHLMLSTKDILSAIFTTSFPFGKIFRRRKHSMKTREDMAEENMDAASSKVDWVYHPFSVMNCRLATNREIIITYIVLCT